MLNGSSKSYFSYQRDFYKFCHLRVPYGAKMDTFCAISKEVGLAGYQNIIAHIKDIAYIYVFL